MGKGGVVMPKVQTAGSYMYMYMYFGLCMCMCMTLYMCPFITDACMQYDILIPAAC